MDQSSVPNGALLYDIERDQVVKQTRLAPDLTCSLIEQLRKVLPGVAFAIEAGVEYGCEEAYAIEVTDE